MLFQILRTMPPESRLRLVKELELCTKAKLEELVRAGPGMTRNNINQHKRRWFKFQDMLDKVACHVRSPV